MGAPAGKIPAFFKVFIPELCSQKMQLPSSFSSYMKGMLPGGATFFRDRHGNIWPVDVTRDGNQFYFENGWVSFVEDNCVEVGHFLTFQFSGDYFYDFIHFDSSTCEKEILGSFKFTVKQEELERERDMAEEFMEQEEDVEEEEGNYGDNQEAEEEYDDDEYEDEDEEDEELDSEEDEEHDEEKEAKVEDNDIVDDEDYDYEEEDTEVGRINMTQPKKNSGRSSVHPKKAGTSMNRSKLGKAAVKDESGSKKIVRKSDQRRGVDIFDSGFIARPKNPYFVAQVDPTKKRNELYIPLEVIKDHNLKFSREIIIRGDDGKEFRSNINTWGDGRKIATNGWKAFCRWHFVKKEHRCLCEFVKSDMLHISVLHFQAGKWMPIFEAEN